MFSSFKHFRDFCIPTRILLCILMYYFSTNIALRVIVGVIGINFLILYFFNLRMNAVESLTGKTWWNEFRIYHGILYSTAAALSLSEYHAYSYIPLLVDACIGMKLLYFSDLK